MFFDQDYEFRGKHAKYVNELKTAIFNRNVDVLILAPVMGLVYNRRAQKDFSSELSTKVFAEQMNKEYKKILFNYRLCMLLCDDNNEKEKIDNAFRYYTGDDDYINIFNKNIDIYNSYILGGVEVLYEIMLKNNEKYNGNNADDVKYKKEIISDVTEFINDYKDQVKDYNTLADLDL